MPEGVCVVPSLSFRQVRPSVLQEHCWLCLYRENRPFTPCSVTQCICDKVQIKAPHNIRRVWVGPAHRMWPVTARGEDKAWALSSKHTIDLFQSFPFFFWSRNESPNSDDRQCPILRADISQYIRFLSWAAFWECNINHCGLLLDQRTNGL